MTISNALTRLSTVLGDRLVLSKADREAHGASETHFPTFPPDGVAYPDNTEEVSEILRICSEEACPVIGYGTGTALEGQTSATQGGISVDFSRMNRLIEIRSEDMIARVQPGITRVELNTEIRATGLMFPIDPGANASIGGMAATRASGTTAVRYGTMRDNVLALELVLADGQIIRTGSAAAKSSAGYDLTALMVGSEGTLGLITELTVKLHGQPEATVAAVCAFENFADAVNSVIMTRQMGIPMARIEFLDTDAVAAVNAYSKASFQESPHLFVEFHGTESGVQEDVRRFGEIVSEMGGGDFEWAQKAEDRTRLWDMRHNAFYACLGLRKGAVAVVTDACVPISKLAEAVAAAKEDIRKSGLIGPIVGHVGDGNFHSALLIEPGNEAELKAAKTVAEKMAKKALALGGTITGEHGIGMGKTNLMADEHGAGWSTMAILKRALDPQNILNPGKLVKLN